MTLTDTKPQGYKIPEIMYDEDLTAQSSVVISNLDGNSDEEYEIEIEGAISLTNSPSIETNLSANWAGVSLIANAGSSATIGSGAESGHPKLGDGFYGGGNTNNVSINVSLTVAKGRYRKFRSDCVVWNASYHGRSFTSGTHTTDTTTNVTTMTINFGGNFTGNVKVYRALPK